MNRLRNPLSVSQENSNCEFQAIPDTPDYQNCFFSEQPATNELYSESESYRGDIRWGNVRPLNISRVKLEDPKNNYSRCDFVEASWVTLGPTQKGIVASAPIQHMFGQWWAMVFMHNVTQIYCLTRETEKGMAKMDVYWPNNVGETVEHDGAGLCNQYIVTTEECEILTDDFIKRRVRIEYKDEQRIVDIYHYTGWPDFGVPDNTAEVLQIIKTIENTCTGTIILHCSAGRGRTGVVVSALRSLWTNEPPAIAVAEIRKQRTGIVQTGSQYHFLKRLVDEILKSCVDSNENL